MFEVTNIIIIIMIIEYFVWFYQVMYYVFTMTAIFRRTVSIS
jgi:hypothetical protein